MKATQNHKVDWVNVSVFIVIALASLYFLGHIVLFIFRQ